MNLREIMTGTSPMDPQNQNLINPSKISTAQHRPGFWRALCLDAVAVLSAALFGYCYYRYLTQGWSVWFLFAALTFFGVASVMEVFLSKGGWRSILIILLEVAAMLGFFWRDDAMVLGIIAAIMIVMLIWGQVSARAQVRNGIEIPFFGASGNVLGKFTTAVLLFMILAYVPQIAGNALIVSQQSFRTFFDWTSGLVNSFYPELSLNGSFGDFAQSVSKMELANNPSFQSLNTAQQNIALQQATTQFTQNFLEDASGTVATSSPASDAFYNVLNGVLSAWQSQSSGWFDIGWVTVLFIGLRTLGILFVWFAQFVCLIFYELLLASGFMKISEEPHSREVIGY
jgi:hypothetical protein